MKESTARIGDTPHSLTHDRTVSECFPCRWPEIKNISRSIYRCEPGLCLYDNSYTLSFLYLLQNKFNFFIENHLC